MKNIISIIILTYIIIFAYCSSSRTWKDNKGNKFKAKMIAQTDKRIFLEHETKILKPLIYKLSTIDKYFVITKRPILILIYFICLILSIIGFLNIVIYAYQSNKVIGVCLFMFSFLTPFYVLCHFNNLKKMFLLTITPIIFLAFEYSAGFEVKNFIGSIRDKSYYKEMLSKRKSLVNKYRPLNKPSGRLK